ESDGEVMKCRLAVSVGPPEFRVLHFELGEVGGLEADNGFAGIEIDVPGDLHVVEGGGEIARSRSGGRVDERRFDFDICFGVVGLGKRGDDIEVADGDGSCGGEGDVLPDAGVAIADGGDPVPALCGFEGGAVEHHDSAIVAGTGLDGFLLREARVRRRADADGEGVDAGSGEERCDVEVTADECSRDAAEVVPVEPDFSRVVDAVEGQGDLPAGSHGGRGELDAIPVVLVGECVGNGEVVEAVVGIGVDAAVDHGGQHGAGDGGDHPVLRREPCLRNLLAGSAYIGCGGELPAAADSPGILSYKLGVLF